jgi:hypothetical protein
LHNPSANGKQGQIPEEISQTLLTNKNLKGNLGLHEMDLAFDDMYGRFRPKVRMV